MCSVCWQGRDRDVQEETLGGDNICRVLWRRLGWRKERAVAVMLGGGKSGADRLVRRDDELEGSRSLSVEA